MEVPASLMRLPLTSVFQRVSITLISDSLS